MNLALLVALGGALGAVSRWGASELLGMAGLPIWVSILTVNAAGSTIMGWAHTRVHALAAPWREHLSALALTGFLGGFTTFSTFSVHTVQLATAGAWFSVLVQVVGTVSLALAGVWLGLRLGRRRGGQAEEEPLQRAAK